MFLGRPAATFLLLGEGSLAHSIVFFARPPSPPPLSHGRLVMVELVVVITCRMTFRPKSLKMRYHRTSTSELQRRGRRFTCHRPGTSSLLGHRRRFPDGDTWGHRRPVSRRRRPWLSRSTTDGHIVAPLRAGRRLLWGDGSGVTGAFAVLRRQRGRPHGDRRCGCDGSRLARARGFTSLRGRALTASWRGRTVRGSNGIIGRRHRYLGQGRSRAYRRILLGGGRVERIER